MSTEERCVCCGDIIPEGRQVCLNCEVKRKGETRMPNMRFTECRACHAPIGFIKTTAGKTVPVDAECLNFLPNEKGPLLFVMVDGSTKRGYKVNKEQDGSEFGYISHFATCPEADKFRKSRKSDRKKG